MPTKTCLYGKHIVTLFFPISKVIENSSNTFSMYLKISKRKHEDRRGTDKGNN